MATDPGAALDQASAVRPAGPDAFRADLHDDWTVGDKPHGGYLMAVLARAGLAAVAEHPDPLVVSAEFLRPPESGPALLRTRVRKRGRRASTVAVSLEQHDTELVTGTVVAGALPDEEPVWQRLPEFAAEPEPDALRFGLDLEGPSKVAELMDTRLSRHNAGMYTDRRAGDDLELRAWTRPVDDKPDVLFALVAGDVLPPLPFNLGRIGWSPTVALTALLRARPAPGWLRVQTESRTVTGEWFDSDATVLDSRGRLVCQARQLAMLARG